jgi:hypothetical protein
MDEVELERHPEGGMIVTMSKRRQTKAAPETEPEEHALSNH